jgi:hypothetical protein
MDKSLKRLRELQEQMMVIREEADRLIAESHRILGDARAEKKPATRGAAKRPKPAR